MTSWPVLALAAVSLLSACTHAGRHASPAPAALGFDGEFSIAPLTRFDALHSARFGGVSGLAFDPSTGDLLGVSDDEDNPRVFVFAVSGEGASFRVDVRAYFPLPVGSAAGGAHDNGRGIPPAALDPEGVAITKTGRLFISSEGVARQPRVPPGIYEYSRRVEFVRSLEIPEKFLPPPTGEVTRGVRDNAAFESLTLTPDGKHLFTATESALVQDGPAADFTHGALSRIIRYDASGGTFQPGREFAYEVDPIAKPDFAARFQINGLVELQAMSATDLLAMERSYAEESSDGRRMNRIRIYRVSLRGASDVSRIESLQNRSAVRPARKTLLLDLNDLQGLSPELRTLDNFEGMTFGPSSGGRPTLLIVSDDNFSQLQRTWFVLLHTRLPR